MSNNSRDSSQSTDASSGDTKNTQQKSSTGNNDTVNKGLGDGNLRGRYRFVVLLVFIVLSGIPAIALAVNNTTHLLAVVIIAVGLVGLVLGFLLIDRWITIKGTKAVNESPWNTQPGIRAKGITSEEGKIEAIGTRIDAEDFRAKRDVTLHQSSSSDPKA